MQLISLRCYIEAREMLIFNTEFILMLAVWLTMNNNVIISKEKKELKLIQSVHQFVRLFHNDSLF